MSVLYTRVHKCTINRYSLFAQNAPTYKEKQQQQQNDRSSGTRKTICAAFCRRAVAKLQRTAITRSESNGAHTSKSCPKPVSRKPISGVEIMSSIYVKTLKTDCMYELEHSTKLCRNVPVKKIGAVLKIM